MVRIEKRNIKITNLTHDIFYIGTINQMYKSDLHHGNNAKIRNKDTLLLFDFLLTRKEIPAVACEKVATDLGSGGGFRRVLWFPQPVTTD